MKNNDETADEEKKGPGALSPFERDLETVRARLDWARKSQDLTVHILTLLSREPSVRDAIGEVLVMVKGFTGFEAVGVRLRDGDDFPYFETRGFPDYFVEAETSLCGRTEKGEVVRDSAGYPILECMCGNILQGRTNPALPFFTPGGSFWTNCTTELLATSSEEERQARTRNRCNGEGYESVALIPLRSNDKIVGLLQLNDSRRDRFTPDTIGFLEGIGVIIGIVLERRRVEEERDRLFTLSVDMLFVAGLDGSFKQVNPAFTRTLGWTEQELLNTQWIEFVHPDDREETLAADRRLADGEPLYSFENRWQHKDGTYRWISWNCVPIPWENLIFGVARDITWRKRAQEKLKASSDELERRVAERTESLKRTNERLRIEVTERKRAEQEVQQARDFLDRIINSMADPIFVKNENHEWILLNDAYCTFMGYACDELIGKSDYDFFPTSEADVFREKDEIVFSTGRDNINEENFTDRKGATHTIVTRKSLYTDASGKKYLVGVIRDITEREQAQAERRRLEARLQQAQKMEAVGTLAGGIAHDFNNLLQVTLGYSELLLAEKSEDDPEYADLRKIQRAAHSGAELVKGLLTFSRKVEFKPIPIDLNAQIAAVEQLLRRTIPRMIDIRFSFAESLQRVNADPAHLEQVIMNLALNARDAVAEGGSITVETANVTLDDRYCGLHPEVEPGDYVRLSVSDTGHGMSRETLDHIFEPFYTTKEVGRGTGLGLAMVYGIVKQHDGHIVCSSEVGGGTTFFVYLPAISAEPQDEVDSAGEMPSFGTETILLVDDENFIRELGERILTRAGYTVLTATNGIEALDIYAAQRDRVALVVLDLIMPAMGGRDCLGELVRLDPEVRILVASGYAADAVMTDCLATGAKGFVSKPFKMKELLRQVRQVLDEG